MILPHHFTLVLQKMRFLDVHIDDRSCKDVIIRVLIHLICQLRMQTAEYRLAVGGYWFVVTVLE